MASAAPRTHEEIEAQIRELQARKAQGPADGGGEGEEEGGVPLTAVYMDEEIYGGGAKAKYEGYVTSIAANDDQDDDEYESTTLMSSKKPELTAPAVFLQELSRGEKDYDPFGDRKIPRIADREDEYRAQRRKFMISPERSDPFADGAADSRSRGNATLGPF